MAFIRATCPRCDTVNSTFEVRGQNYLGKYQSNWQRSFEVFSVCGHCHKAMIHLVVQTSYAYEHFFANELNCLTAFGGYINDIVDYEGYVNLSDLAQQQPPEHLPADIIIAFQEAATCQSVQCWNASSAMYRACLDLATKPLMPPEGEEPNRNIRRSLGLRLKWLFENGRMAKSLEELSHCIQQDGNDGVHDVNLTQAVVDDIADFTVEVLQTLYTVPARLRLAQERREQRRQTNVS
ncbi:DUF4145 domain-containing protein [Phyllobacterium sp.]|uniref:DUF4145 domain-containing protein n=1 Tax=unclassified Phyllobacterium TaxID=2638441 RepID=UPI0031FBB270|nr:DUF4145 domain-containing protein [Phyllobacterium sp.]